MLQKNTVIYSFKGGASIKQCKQGHIRRVSSIKNVRNDFKHNCFQSSDEPGKQSARQVTSHLY